MRQWPKRKKLVDPNNPFEQKSCFIAKGTFKILSQMSKEMTLPIGRLIAIAVDVELDKPNPFAYPCSASLAPPSNDSYSMEAHKIASYLLNFPSGTGRDTLMLCRRNIGIPDRDKFLLAYKELLRSGAAEEGKHPPRHVKFRYHPSYVWVRLVGADRAALIARRRRMMNAAKRELGHPTALGLLSDE